MGTVKFLHFPGVGRALFWLALGSQFSLGRQGVPQDVPQVLDMRYPGPGVGIVSVDWRSYSIGFPVRFAGDVDGDGRDDLVLENQALVADALPDCIVLYGVPRSALSREVPIESLRQTRFVASEPTGIGAVKISAVGDVDGDGYADIAVSNLFTAWQGVPRSGISILIFGSPSMPKEVSFE